MPREWKLSQVYLQDSTAFRNAQFRSAISIPVYDLTNDNLDTILLVSSMMLWDYRFPF